MRISARTCCIVLLFATISLTTGASPDVERRYLLEVIIFKNTGPDSSDGELWKKDFLLPPETTNTDYEPEPVAPPTEMPADTAELPDTPRQAVENQPELVHMIDILTKLENSRRYDVLVRRAWTQPMRNRNDAIRVPVGINPALTANTQTAMLYPSPSPLSGTVAMYEHRLLFVDVDVSARIPTALASDPSSLVNPVELEYRITETRRVKLNEVHYFDHPYFGVLIRVSRVDPAESGEQVEPVTDESAPEAQIPDSPASAPPN